MRIVGFLNGSIYVSFKPMRKVNAMVIAGDRVLYIGDNAKARSIVNSLNGEIVDLDGKTVLPGFIDSHMHLDSLGIYLNMLDLRGVRSIDELKNRLREYSNRARTSWIIGHGWDHELFEERRWPSRYDIDEVVSDKPVILTRICLHAGVLNTKALEQTSLIHSNLKDVERDEQGRPTGIVKEKALEIAKERFKEILGIGDYEKILEDAIKYALSQGVTTLGFMSCDLKSLNALFRLRHRGKLKARIRVYLTPGIGKSSETALYDTGLIDMLIKLGIKTGFGDDYLKIMGVKILADGSLGARTAWLSDPYSDDPSTHGYPNIERDVLKKVAREVHHAGLQLAIHGIGDKTIDMILETYSELDDVERYRHRIEHASLLRDDQLVKISRIGIAISVQPHFVISDWWAKRRVGEKRVKWLYRFKSIMSMKIPIGLSTDSPVEPLNPWETIYAAVTRGKYDSVEYYRDTKDECIGLEDALYAYTYGSAYILHEERELGSLEPGKLADFVVVDKDPFSVCERELKDVKVLETYVSGIKVWP
ncbi:MAG: amidohydrolase [Desulfurococcaceae archaeon]